MFKSKRIAAIIFDLDGLVLDTEHTYHLAWQHAALTMNLDLSDAFCLSLSGLHHLAIRQKLIERFGSDFDLQHFHATAGECWQTLIDKHGIAIKAGFCELLKAIQYRSLPYCLATNSPKINALKCLDVAGLTGAFPVSFSRDEVNCGKPAPDLFILAAATLQSPLGNCLILEDSYTGILAASQAGAMSVYVPSIFPAEPAAITLADVVAHDLHHVLAMLKTEQCL